MMKEGLCPAPAQHLTHLRLGQSILTVRMFSSWVSWFYYFQSARGLVPN